MSTAARSIPPADRDNRSVDQQRDAPDGVMRERGPSDRMRLPHERDESAATNTASDKAPGQHDLIGQASEDLASGQQDTDCRNRNPGQSDCPPRPDIAQGRDASGAVEHDRAKPGGQTGRPRTEKDARR